MKKLQPVKLLLIPEVIRVLGVSESTVYREIAAGRLRKVKVRGRSAIPESSVVAYQQRQGVFS